MDIILLNRGIIIYKQGKYMFIGREAGETIKPQISKTGENDYVHRLFSKNHRLYVEHSLKQ